MKALLFIFLLGICTISAQEKETISQNREAYIGVKTKIDFLQEPHAKWFNEEYEHYEYQNKIIQKLKKHKDQISIKVFMSVWCHDSHREIPRLYKILEAVNFDISRLEVIALNRAKKAPGNPQENFDIQRTPTLIFFKNGDEIGRFVEKPIQRLEKDLLKIWSGKNYKHAYAKD